MKNEKLINRLYLMDIWIIAFALTVIPVMVLLHSFQKMNIELDNNHNLLILLFSILTPFIILLIKPIRRGLESFMGITASKELALKLKIGDIIQIKKRTYLETWKIENFEETYVLLVSVESNAVKKEVKIHQLTRLLLIKEAILNPTKEGNNA